MRKRSHYPRACFDLDLFLFIRAIWRCHTFKTRKPLACFVLPIASRFDSTVTAATTTTTTTFAKRKHNAHLDFFRRSVAPGISPSSGRLSSWLPSGERTLRMATSSWGEVAPQFAGIVCPPLIRRRFLSSLKFTNNIVFREKNHFTKVLSLFRARGELPPFETVCPGRIFLFRGNRDSLLPWVASISSELLQLPRPPATTFVVLLLLLSTVVAAT